MKKSIARILAALMVFGVMVGFGGAVYAQDDNGDTVPPQVFINVGSVNVSAERDTATVIVSGGAVTNAGVWAHGDVPWIWVESFTAGSVTLGTLPTYEHFGRPHTVTLQVATAEGSFSWPLVVIVGTPDVRTENAEFEIVPFQHHVDLAPGVRTEVTVTIRNTSGFDAANVVLNAVPNANFTVDILPVTGHSNIRAGGQREFRIAITPNMGATFGAGIVDVPFAVQFTNNLQQIRRQSGFSVPVLVNVPPEETPTEPRVLFTNFDIPNNIAAGDSFSVTLTMQNTSGVVADNVELSVSGMTSNVTLSSQPIVFAGSIGAGGTATATFTFDTRAAMATGATNLIFSVIHQMADGRTFSAPRTIEIPATVIAQDDEPATDRATLEITNITAPTGLIQVGAEGRITLTVRNTGELPAANIRINAAPETGIVPRLASIQNLQTLNPGESHTFTFAFAPINATVSRFFNVGFSISYDAWPGADARDSFEISSGFNVYVPEEDEAPGAARSVPRIIISDYVLEPRIVMANSEFDLTLEMQNTHSELSIGNILVTWQVQIPPAVQGMAAQVDATFLPVDASNTFFIEYIPPRGTVEQHMRLFTIPDAAARNHTMNVRFTYEVVGGDGSVITHEENIGINVRQVPNLVLGDIWIQDFAMVGDRIPVSFVVQNMGMSILGNLRIRIEGEGIDGTNADQPFGNAGPGWWNSFWGDFSPFMPGDTTVYVIASFTDELGELHEYIREFPIHVMGGFGGDFEGGFGFDDFERPGFGWPMEDDEDSGFQLFGGWMLWVWGGGGALLVGGVTTGLVIRKRRKANGADDFDFDK